MPHRTNCAQKTQSSVVSNLGIVLRLRHSVGESKRNRTPNLLYAPILHLIAGFVTGSVFKIKTLLVILCCLAAELAGASCLDSGQIAMGVLVSIIALQVGYATGLLTRATIERALNRILSETPRQAP